jgi:putative photosynthetic complex assembly protein
MTFREAPALAERDKEMIPRGLLRGMLALVLLSLALTTYAVVSGRDKVGRPAPGGVVAERMIVLTGGEGQSVTVTAGDKVLAEMDHGGFVTVIQNGLMTERRKHDVDQGLPVRLVKYDNGRFAVEDPATGWSVELYAFGSDNEAAFARFLEP